MQRLAAREGDAAARLVVEDAVASRSRRSARRRVIRSPDQLARARSGTPRRRRRRCRTSSAAPAPAVGAGAMASCGQAAVQAPHRTQRSARGMNSGCERLALGAVAPRAARAGSPSGTRSSGCPGRRGSRSARSAGPCPRRRAGRETPGRSRSRRSRQASQSRLPVSALAENRHHLRRSARRRRASCASPRARRRPRLPPEARPRSPRARAPPRRRPTRSRSCRRARTARPAAAGRRVPRASVGPAAAVAHVRWKRDVQVVRPRHDRAAARPPHRAGRSPCVPGGRPAPRARRVEAGREPRRRRFERAHHQEHLAHVVRGQRRHHRAQHRARPRRRATNPSCCSRCSAARTGVRLTPSRCESSASTSGAPGARRPATIRSRTRR